MELAGGRPELAQLEALEADAEELPGAVPELEPLRACATLSDVSRFSKSEEDLGSCPAQCAIRPSRA